MPIPVAVGSKAWVCGRSLAGIMVSNPVGGVDVYLLRVLYVERWRSVRRADHSSRGALPNVLCQCDSEASTVRRPWSTRAVEQWIYMCVYIYICVCVCVYVCACMCVCTKNIKRAWHSEFHVINLNNFLLITCKNHVKKGWDRFAACVLVAVQQLHKYRYNSTYVRETKKLIYKINIYLCGTMCSIPVITHILRPARLRI